jgi:glutamyl/glutaminyl-tRNA synthetase
LAEEIKPFYITPEISAEYTELSEEENSQNIFNSWAEKLAEKDVWQEDEINALIKETTTATGAKGKNLYFPIRLALFGTVHGPEIPLIIGLIGTKEAIKRFRNLIK